MVWILGGFCGGCIVGCFCGFDLCGGFVCAGDSLISVLGLD